MAKWTVQVNRETDEDGGSTWMDIGTVDAPHRARRNTILKLALRSEEVGSSDFLDGLQRGFRILDEASAKEHPVKARQQTTLEIG